MMTTTRTNVPATQAPIDRRRVLLAGGAVFMAAQLPRLARAADGRDPRLIVIVLRGALDGLAAVPPLGDPDYAALRGALALSREGDQRALPLDGFFALHPAMPNVARLYANKQALIAHAVATPYRQRSHFDGQDVLESGFAGPGQTRSGWLNRALSALPTIEAARGAGASRQALGVGVATPLILRGPAPVVGWAPTNLPVAEEDLATRLLDLYAKQDPELGKTLASGLDIEKLASRAMPGQAPAPGVNIMRRVAAGAARLMAAPDGPRIAALAFDGWDTHANEGAAGGRLANLLAGLDGALEEIEKALGPAWRQTVVAVVTEFGRTAHVNGAIGTDHGVGTTALLAGGAVAGGRVASDWPGLKSAQLYEQRDLRPTMDLRALLKGVLSDHLQLSTSALASSVFPDSAAVAPMRGLIV